MDADRSISHPLLSTAAMCFVLFMMCFTPIIGEALVIEVPDGSPGTPDNGAIFKGIIDIDENEHAIVSLPGPVQNGVLVLLEAPSFKVSDMVFFLSVNGVPSAVMFSDPDNELLGHPGSEGDIADVPSFPDISGFPPGTVVAVVEAFPLLVEIVGNLDGHRQVFATYQVKSDIDIILIEAPNPSTLASLAAGMLCLLGLAWRRR